MKNPVGVDQYAFKQQLLQRSDWTQLPDVPLTDEQKTAWAAYRQQLRDVVAYRGVLDQIDFPDLPTL